MAKPNLIRLTDEDLVELGALLETEQATVKAELATLRGIVPAARAKLAIPGLKFGINLSLGAAGFLLAPLNFGLSMLLTIAGSGMTVWDGIEIGRDAAAFIRMELRIRRLTDRSAEIEAQLFDIDALLTQRLGPP